MIESKIKDAVLDDFSWSCDLPQTMKEIAENSNIGVYKPAMKILANLLCQVAQRSAELNDPIMNILMLKLKLYEVPHYEIQEIIKKQRERIQQVTSANINQ